MLLISSGLVNLPRARAVPMPAVTVATSLLACCQGVRATLSSSFKASAGLTAGAGGAAGGASTAEVAEVAVVAL